MIRRHEKLQRVREGCEIFRQHSLDPFDEQLPLYLHDFLLKRFSMQPSRIGSELFGLRTQCVCVKPLLRRQ